MGYILGHLIMEGVDRILENKTLGLSHSLSGGVGGEGFGSTHVRSFHSPVDSVI